MTPVPDGNNLAREGEGDAHVRQKLAALDEDLMRGMAGDHRLESGVPEGQRSNSLDFIQMTGLTRPPLRQSPVLRAYDDAPARPDDLNPGAPLSFYEKGVRDVDDEAGEAHAPIFQAIDFDADLDAGIFKRASASGTSPAVDAFRDIIAGLEREEGSAAAVPDDALETTADSTSLSGMLVAMVDEFESALNGTARAGEEAGIVEPEAGTEETVAEGDSFDELLDSIHSNAEAIAPAQERAGDTAQTAETADREHRPDFTTGTGSPAGTGDTAASGPASGNLAKAEQLMHELAARAPMSSEAEPPPESTALVARSTPAGNGDAEGAAPPEYAIVPPRRRSRRPSRIARKTRRVLKLVLFLLLAAAAAASLWYFALVPYLEQPEDLEVTAAQLMEERKYGEASVAFLQLARRMPPERPERAAAQFRAAHALTLGPERAMDDTRSRYETAIKLFESFVEDHPLHPKRTRAECIMGRLYYQLEDYDTAITMLRDRVKPVDDPAAALTMLRYLARSYDKKGAHEEAETAYLQAATLPGNYSAETDYRELGDMFGTRAGLASDPAESARLKDKAVAYWNRALQVPGINPGDLDTLRQRLEWLTFTGESGIERATAAGGAPDGAAPAIALPDAPADSATPIPVAGDGAGRIEDPAAEIEVVAPRIDAPAAADVPADDAVDN